MNQKWKQNFGKLALIDNFYLGLTAAEVVWLNPGLADADCGLAFYFYVWSGYSPFQSLSLHSDKYPTNTAPAEFELIMVWSSVRRNKPVLLLRKCNQSDRLILDTFFLP